jgi:hypothetical protein
VQDVRRRLGILTITAELATLVELLRRHGTAHGT